MWNCPTCNRAFKNENQAHFCVEKPATIDEYIRQQPQEIQQYLVKVREVIREAIPEAQEKISWSMPTFWRGHNIIHFASAKMHLGIYPGAEAVSYFAEQLKGYKTSKGAIQFPYNKPIPYDMIAQIAVWCYETRNHHSI